MDETPEELEEIRREAALIDPYKYKKRMRAMAAIAFGGLAAGAVALGLKMKDDARNPCERLRNFLCHQDARSATCTTYDEIFKESVEDENATMRQNIRSQCVKKIDSLKEDGQTVK